jgi:hypothetical protein
VYARANASAPVLSLSPSLPPFLPPSPSQGVSQDHAESGVIVLVDVPVSGPRAPRGGVARQGIALTDLHSDLLIDDKPSSSFTPSPSLPLSTIALPLSTIAPPPPGPSLFLPLSPSHTHTHKHTHTHTASFPVPFRETLCGTWPVWPQNGDLESVLDPMSHTIRARERQARVRWSQDPCVARVCVRE